MSSSLIPRCRTSKILCAVAHQHLKRLTLACRSLQTGRPSPSATGVAAAADHATARPYEEIPGPKPLPILGNAWRFLPFVGEYAGLGSDQLSRELHAKYGPVIRFGGILGRRDMVFIFRPEDVEIALRNEGPWPYREGIKVMEYYRNVFRKDFYQGASSVLTDQGSRWGEARTKVNQPMMQPRISKRYIAPITGVSQEFVEKMRAMRDENDELPSHFINELFKWSLESIAYVALDTRLGCLEPNLAPDSEPQRMIDAVNTILEEMYNMEFGLPFWKLFPTPTWKKFVNAQDTFLELSVKYVQAAIERAEKRKKESVEKEGEPSVLERLLARTDPKTASIMAQDMLFGGIDTTSYSIAIAMYVLSRNQDKQELLFGELKRFMPRKDSFLTEDMLEDMKYLKAVFKESMRMKPIVGWNMRKTVKEIVLSEHRVPEGVNVFMPNLMYRTSEDVYPLGKRFIPERWLKTRPSGDDAAGSPEDFDAVSHAKPHPFAFLPFGFGPRMCVGKRFAELEMGILLAKIIRNFRVDYKYDDLKFVSRLLNTPIDPLRFQLTDRSE